MHINPCYPSETHMHQRTFGDAWENGLSTVHVRHQNIVANITHRNDKKFTKNEKSYMDMLWEKFQ